MSTNRDQTLERVAMCDETATSATDVRKEARSVHLL
jgi:hypothetical protein